MDCFFKSNNQYRKKKRLAISNAGKNKVNTDKIGKKLGAKKGKI
jgi:hypothetical protein